jgi:hypothetical protein
MPAGSDEEEEVGEHYDSKLEDPPLVCFFKHVHSFRSATL